MGNILLGASEKQIGVYGFSAGGYTGLGLIGGVPDVEEAANHCKAAPEEYACAEGLVDAMVAADMGSLAAEAWGADPRVSAASLSAPGLPFPVATSLKRQTRKNTK